MPSRVKWRARARGALEHYFSRRSAPRRTLAAIVSTAGVAGFLISFGLLREGVTEMAVRYFLAVLGAYLTGLALLRFWVELERHRFDHEHFAELARDAEAHVLPEGEAPFQRGRKSGGSWLRHLDLPDFGDVGDLEGCLGVILVGALLAAIVWIVVFVVTSASSLLAEVFLDAFFVSAIYRRLRVAAVEHWLGTALRRTWPQVTLLALALSLLGFLLQRAAPGAHSIGPALHEIISPPAPR